MRRVVLRDCGLDALTVALAFAYFETLVLRGAINKANREAILSIRVATFWSFATFLKGVYFPHNSNWQP